MTPVLFLAHYFPPIGGAGVQRSAKFVKHLPGLGILPLVLTGEGKPSDRWTPEDRSLQADVPTEVPVIRVAVPGADSLDREARMRRRHEAFVKAGSGAIAEHRPKAILVTMSPFDDALIAAELARKYNLPWVADLRDPWALDEFQVYRSFWHRQRERRKMESYLGSAASIIMNTPEAMRKFRAAFPRLASRARVAITNGYDVEEFQVNWNRPRNLKFTLVHSGYLHTESGLHQQRRSFEYRLLGRIEPGVRILPRSHFYLMQALEKWLSQDASLVGNFRAEFIGVGSPTDEALVRNSPARELVRFTGYLPHSECVQRVMNADLVFLPMHQVPAGTRASIVPGKTYEYMATRRPILAAVPESDAKDFLKAAGTARLCDPEDVGQMLEALRSAYAEWKSGADGSSRWNAVAVQRFERANLTKQLRDELLALI